MTFDGGFEVSKALLVRGLVCRNALLNACRSLLDGLKQGVQGLEFSHVNSEFGRLVSTRHSRGTRCGGDTSTRVRIREVLGFLLLGSSLTLGDTLVHFRNGFLSVGFAPVRFASAPL